jgi:hypothetical protein
MKKTIVSLVIAATAVSTTALPSLAQINLTETSQVGTNGIGVVLVGQTIAEASKVSGLKMELVYGEPKVCAYFRPVGGLDGVSFMVSDNRIARVDISNPRISTFRGAKIGDSEQRIKSLYQGQIKVQKHPYNRFGGHYLIFVPKDREDKNYRVIFETDGKKVLRYRSGKLPEVDYIEGCS